MRKCFTDDAHHSSHLKLFLNLVIQRKKKVKMSKNRLKNWINQNASTFRVRSTTFINVIFVNLFGIHSGAAKSSQHTAFFIKKKTKIYISNIDK